MVSSLVVGGSGRVVAADGDHVVVVRRIRDTGRAVPGLVAGVAGCGDDHDAGVPRLLRRERQRIAQRVLVRVRSVRQVQHPDVHSVVVLVLNHPVDRRDDLRDIDAAVGRADLHVHDAGIGRDAAVLGVGLRGVGLR